MTVSGHTHVQTPIAGLVDLALKDPVLADVARRAADRPSDLTLVGPASARLFAASALAQAGPLLVVTATGDTLRQARDTAYEGVRAIRFRGMQVRRDIASRALF